MAVCCSRGEAQARCDTACSPGTTGLVRVIALCVRRVPGGSFLLGLRDLRRGHHGSALLDAVRHRRVIAICRRHCGLGDKRPLFKLRRGPESYLGRGSVRLNDFR